MKDYQEIYSTRIRRLLSERDLNGLVSALRNPANVEFRLQAAQALGELQDLDATESLVRSTLEDPSPVIQVAARRALVQILGNQADLVIRTYQSGQPEEEPWLVNPEDEETLPEEGEKDPEGIDLEGLIRVATHESNPALRLAAIRLLARSSDLRATDVLAYLALRGDSQPLREAARQAMETRFGEEAGSILQGYRETLQGISADELHLSDEEEGEELSADELDFENIDDEEVELAEEDEDGGNETVLDEEDESPLATRRPTGFPRMPTNGAPYRGNVVEEIGIPWGTILLVGLVVLVILVILYLSGML